MTREWPALAGEISGFGTERPEYEAACRRMVLAAADWLEQHPRVFIDWRERRPRVPGTPDEQIALVSNWENVIRPMNDRTRDLCQVMHAACCGDEGDRAGPSYMMMAKALQHARYIKAQGWDAYVAMLAGRRDGDEGVA